LNKKVSIGTLGRKQSLKFIWDIEQAKAEESIKEPEVSVAATQQPEEEQVKEVQNVPAGDNKAQVAEQQPIAHVDTPQVTKPLPQEPQQQPAPQVESIQKPEPVVPVPLESSEVSSQLPPVAPQPAQPVPAVSQEQPDKPASEAKSSRCTIM
jgi:hypothetical protein